MYNIHSLFTLFTILSEVKNDLLKNGSSIFGEVQHFIVVITSFVMLWSFLASLLLCNRLVARVASIKTGFHFTSRTTSSASSQYLQLNCTSLNLDLSKYKDLQETRQSLGTQLFARQVELCDKFYMVYRDSEHKRTF